MKDLLWEKKELKKGRLLQLESIEANNHIFFELSLFSCLILLKKVCYTYQQLSSQSNYRTCK